jgi:signal transduction histidine kinase
MDAERLSEAFQNFMTASKNLENYYGMLQEKVRYLTTELKEKNRQLNDALREAETSRDYLNAILYNLEEAIIVLDREDVITMINKSAETLLELGPKDIGKAFNSLDLSIVRSGPDTILKVNGKRYNVILSRSGVVDSKGDLRGNVILIKDITGLKEIEVQHERNQRLIAMGEMIIKMTHEIRNSLCSIELFSNLLERELQGTDFERLARGISIGIGNLNNILTNMLSFVRDHKPVRRPIRLDKTIEESIEMLVPLMETRNIRIEKSLYGCNIHADPELLKQVLMNIIINAIQAMPERGKIEILMREDEGFTIVDVKDNGVGIKSEDMEKIFDPFFSTKERGTGLGLTIALKIMQNHDGYIKVLSEEGKGCVFSLYFPKSDNGEGLDGLKAD